MRSKWFLFTVLIIVAYSVYFIRSNPKTEGSTEFASIATGSKVGQMPVQSQVTAATKGGDKNVEDFKKASSQEWNIRSEDETRRVFSGGTMPLAANEKAIQEFIHNYSWGLFGVSPEQLYLDKIESADRTKVQYSQRVNGLEIYAAQLTMFFENGMLVRMQNDLIPSKDLPIEGSFVLTVEEVNAKIFSSKNLVAQPHLKSGEWKIETQPDPVFYVSMKTLHPAYRVVASSGEKTQEVIVDANTGRIIRTSSLIFE